MKKGASITKKKAYTCTKNGGRWIALVLAIICVAVLFSGCGKKTLANVSIYHDVDYYNRINVRFFGEKQECIDGHSNCCYVYYEAFKDNPTSPTGKISDPKRGKSEHKTCTFDDSIVTLFSFDSYTYEIVEEGESAYVEFSKPFLGYTTWKVQGWIKD